MKAGRSTWVRTAIIAVAASVLSVFATSVVVSAQGGGQEQIHACADARGTLRKVPASESCASGESRVTWNVEGPAGAAGPAGQAGATGAPGPQGMRGRPGRKGKIDLSGYDVKTGVILARLKQLDKKVSDVKKTVLFNKGYLKGHHASTAEVCAALKEHDERLANNHYLYAGGSGPVAYLPLSYC